MGDDLDVETEIDSPALDAEGITQDQPVSIELRECTGDEIRLEILTRANPGAADGPFDLRQRLVYVCDGAADQGRGRIIVTTRSAAGNRGFRLPEVFVGAGR